MTPSRGSLSNQRRAVQDRIHERRELFRSQRSHLAQRIDAWMGTPRSLVQAFLAGFLADQARALVPGAPIPWKVLPLWWMRGIL
jgi:hypothetical protein